MNDATSGGVPRNPSLKPLRTIHRMNRMLPAMAEYRSHDLTLLTPCLRYGGQHHSEHWAHQRRPMRPLHCSSIPPPAAKEALVRPP